jgi:hypothetical protein
MTTIMEPDVHFLPLFFSPNPWMGVVSDRNVVPLSVKVITVPSGKDQIRVDLVDVFSVTGYIPPYPKTKASQNSLLRTILDAVVIKTGKGVEPFKWDVVIYGGE